jgi:hypothetical protein
MVDLTKELWGCVWYCPYSDRRQAIGEREFVVIGDG